MSPFFISLALMNIGRNLRNIAIKNNSITVGENNTVLPFRGVINFHGGYDTVDISGNTLTNGNMGIYFRNRGMNMVMNGNKIQNMRGIGINFDGFQYELFDNVKISENDIQADRIALNLSFGQNFKLINNVLVAPRRINGQAQFYLQKSGS